MTLEQLEKAFTMPEEPKPEGLDLAAIEKQLGQKFIPADKFESELARRDALYEHRSGMKTEQELVSKSMASLLGENATARDKYLIERALRSELTDPANRTLYPEGHPLRETEFAPMNEKSLGELIEKVKKQIALDEGAELAASGDKGIKKVSSVAGSQSKQPPKAPKPGDENRRPGNLPSKAAVEAEYAKRVQRRGGGPVSSMGA